MDKGFLLLGAIWLTLDTLSRIHIALALISWRNQAHEDSVAHKLLLFGITKSFRQLVDSRAKFSVYAIKEEFLSRKDREGLMLVEAIEKQLAKRKRLHKGTENVPLNKPTT